eukprot:gene14903-20951_t
MDLHHLRERLQRSLQDTLQILNVTTIGCSLIPTTPCARHPSRGMLLTASPNQATPPDCRQLQPGSASSFQGSPGLCQLGDSASTPPTHSSPDLYQLGNSTSSTPTQSSPDLCQLGSSASSTPTHSSPDLCQVGSSASSTPTHSFPDLCQLGSSASSTPTHSSPDLSHPSTPPSQGNHAGQPGVVPSAPPCHVLSPPMHLPSASLSHHISPTMELASLNVPAHHELASHHVPAHHELASHHVPGHHELALHHVPAHHELASYHVSNRDLSSQHVSTHDSSTQYHSKHHVSTQHVPNHDLSTRYQPMYLTAPPPLGDSTPPSGTGTGLTATPPSGNSTPPPGACTPLAMELSTTGALVARPVAKRLPPPHHSADLHQVMLGSPPALEFTTTGVLVLPHDLAVEPPPHSADPHPVEPGPPPALEFTSTGVLVLPHDLAGEPPPPAQQAVHQSHPHEHKPHLPAHHRVVQGAVLQAGHAPLQAVHAAPQAVHAPHPPGRVGRPSDPSERVTPRSRRICERSGHDSLMSNYAHGTTSNDLGFVTAAAIMYHGPAGDDTHLPAAAAHMYHGTTAACTYQGTGAAQAAIRTNMPEVEESGYTTYVVTSHVIASPSEGVAEHVAEGVTEEPPTTNMQPSARQPLAVGTLENASEPARANIIPPAFTPPEPNLDTHPVVPEDLSSLYSRDSCMSTEVPPAPDHATCHRLGPQSPPLGQGPPQPLGQWIVDRSSSCSSNSNSDSKSVLQWQAMLLRSSSRSSCSSHAPSDLALLNITLPLHAHAHVYATSHAPFDDSAHDHSIGLSASTSESLYPGADVLVVEQTSSWLEKESIQGHPDFSLELLVDQIDAGDGDSISAAQHMEGYLLQKRLQSIAQSALDIAAAVSNTKLPGVGYVGKGPMGAAGGAADKGFVGPQPLHWHLPTLQAQAKLQQARQVEQTQRLKQQQQQHQWLLKRWGSLGVGQKLVQGQKGGQPTPDVVGAGEEGAAGSSRQAGLKGKLEGPAAVDRAGTRKVPGNDMQSNRHVSPMAKAKAWGSAAPTRGPAPVKRTLQNQHSAPTEGVDNLGPQSLALRPKGQLGSTSSVPTPGGSVLQHPSGGTRITKVPRDNTVGSTARCPYTTTPVRAELSVPNAGERRQPGVGGAYMPPKDPFIDHPYLKAHQAKSKGSKPDGAGKEVASKVNTNTNTKAPLIQYLAAARKLPAGGAEVHRDIPPVAKLPLINHLAAAQKLLDSIKEVRTRDISPAARLADLTLQAPSSQLPSPQQRQVHLNPDPGHAKPTASEGRLLPLVPPPAGTRPNLRRYGASDCGQGAAGGPDTAVLGAASSGMRSLSMPGGYRSAAGQLPSSNPAVPEDSTP